MGTGGLFEFTRRVAQVDCDFTGMTAPALNAFEAGPTVALPVDAGGRTVVSCSLPRDGTRACGDSAQPVAVGPMCRTT